MTTARPRRAAGRLFGHALTALPTAGLLDVAAYSAQSSPADGPGATPLLTGLLLLCLLVLSLVSVVDSMRWAAAVRLGWLWRLAWLAAVLPVAALLFALVAHAADPRETALSRGSTLAGYVAGVLLVHALNRRAARRAAS